MDQNQKAFLVFHYLKKRRLLKPTSRNTPLPPCPFGDRLGFYACFGLKQANLCTNTLVVSQCEATCGKFVNENNNQVENCKQNQD